MFSVSSGAVLGAGMRVMPQTLSFNYYRQHEAKLKGQPPTIYEVLSDPRGISCVRNDETEATHVFPPHGIQGPRGHELIKREDDTQSRVLETRSTPSKKAGDWELEALHLPSRQPPVTES